MGFLMILVWDKKLVSFFSEKICLQTFSVHLKQLTTWIGHSRASPGCRTLTLAWTRALPVRCPVPRGILKWVKLSTPPCNMWCICHTVFCFDVFVFLVTQALSQECLNNMFLMWQVLMNLRQPDLQMSSVSLLLIFVPGLLVCCFLVYESINQIIKPTADIAKTFKTVRKFWNS